MEPSIIYKLQIKNSERLASSPMELLSSFFPLAMDSKTRLLTESLVPSEISPLPASSYGIGGINRQIIYEPQKQRNRDDMGYTTHSIEENAGS